MIKMYKKIKFCLPLIGFLAFVKNASALPEQPELLLEDPKRPTKKISSDLGISQKEFIECFKNVRPAQGSNPNAAKVHANKKILLSCLQKSNSTITNEMLDEVMDKYRPGGHQAQVPIDQ